jgi:hypothetical protein
MTKEPQVYRRDRIRPAFVINAKAIWTSFLVSAIAFPLPGQDAPGVPATDDDDPPQALVLVEKGVSLAPIVVFRDAPPYTRRAADELADAIEKISGARPEVIEGEPRPVPIKARPADNVIMVSIANFFGRTDLVDRGSTRGTTRRGCEKIGTGTFANAVFPGFSPFALGASPIFSQSHREQFEAWGKLAPRLMWRPNTGSPAGWQQGLPDLSVAQTILDLKSVAEHHCIGIFIDSVWEHWATRGPQYYAMAQLIWNPSRDGQAVLDDYYARAFGPAAEHVRAYYELLEQARMAYVQEFGYEAGVLNLPQLYTDDLLSRASSHLQRAAALKELGQVPDQANVIRRRIEFVRVGLAFTKQAVENIGLMKGYW